MESDATREAVNELWNDEGLSELRWAVCETIEENLRNITSWLAVDALIGGSRFTGCERETTTAADDELQSYVGVSAVVQMASELVTGCVALLRKDLAYATAALVRQLIEAEYPLASFADDLLAAGRWLTSSPETIRKTFSPQAMRKQSNGRFADREYWDHWEIRGHPAPGGAVMLQMMTFKKRDVERPVAVAVDLPSTSHVCGEPCTSF